MRALALRNVYRGVDGPIFQATVPQKLFPVPLAVAGGSALRVRGNMYSYKITNSKDHHYNSLEIHSLPSSKKKYL
jgi:hypothetical protein